MDIIYIALGILLISSIAVNVRLFLKIKSFKKSKMESLELKEFLGDLLTSKSALVQIRRVDQANLFLKSPRDM